MGRLTGLAAAAVGAAAMLAAAPPALAADAGSGIDTLPTPPAAASDRPAGKGPGAPRVFISPSGEPFRQAPGVPDPLKAWFDQVDAGHKGYIDRADFRADATRFFKKLDENGDGVIDGFEVADYEAKVAPELTQWANAEFPGQFGQARGQGGSRRGRQGDESAQASQADSSAQRRERNAQRGVFQLINEPEPVTDADFNLDSHITFEEWIRAADRRFQILDANKDGRVTLEELRARFLPTKK